MKKYFAIILFSVLLYCFTGCEENKMIAYENDPAVYFSWSQAFGAQRDSINHTFFFLPDEVQQDTIWVIVNTMGKLEPADRPVAIVQTNIGKPGAAISGVHFLPFDHPGIREKMIVPANTSRARIPVVVIRDKSLDLIQVRIELEVEKNDYFRPGIDAWRKLTVTTTCMAEKPPMWDDFWAVHFGPTFGTEKLRFILNTIGRIDWTTTPSEVFLMVYWKNLLQTTLADYNDAHDEPLREADGTLVTFD